MKVHAYDANGNTLTDAQGRSFTWDFENRLTQVVNPGVGTTTFRYDPFGRRVQKYGPVGTTNYLYDGDNLIQVLDPSGNALSRYTFGPQVDEPLSEVSSGTVTYYEQDRLGSVTSLSNPTGAVGGTYTYDSFGNVTASTGTLTSRFEYTAREFDAETGIYFYRARYYDQKAGRFLREDPMKGMSDGVNFYAYVHNNPVGLIDPSGMCPCADAPKYRLVPISDCSHPGYREIVYELQGPNAINWWVTEHQNPAHSAPAAHGSPEGQSTGDSNDGPGGFDDTLFGWRIENSEQTFTISPQDPRKFPNTPSCPVDVQLPSGPNGTPQDYRKLGQWHGGLKGYQFINGNSTGWVPCNPTYDQK